MEGKSVLPIGGVLRNRIEELGILKLFIRDVTTIPKLTFDDKTTWLLFPAQISCGESRLDPTRPSVVIDYAQGPNLPGYRPVPDDLAGPKGLSIRDEVRIVRRGFYLGRAYFRERFALNFTLLDPATAGGASSSSETFRRTAMARVRPPANARSIVVLCLVALVVTSVAGCGQRGPRPGTVKDEAQRAGLAARAFRAGDRRLFPRHGRQPRPRRRPVFTEAEIRGRNMWIVWTGGNDRLWDRLTIDSLGTVSIC